MTIRKGCFDKKVRPFVDRETCIQALKDALSNLGQKNYSVLVYYGIGGIGKTSLRKEFPRCFEEYNLEYPNQELIWASIDLQLDKFREKTTFLITLKTDLQKKYKINFPAFEIAHTIYWKKTNPESPLRKDNYLLFDGDDAFDDFFGVVDEIPYFSLVPTVGRLLNNFPDYLRKWWKKRGQEELSKLSEKEPLEIKEMLPYFWAQDLNNFLKDTSKSAVLFIDTYEALWENNRGQGNFNSKDKWIRDLVAELPRVLWVICGREALRWEETDTEWKEYLEQHYIENLPEKNAIDLLNLCGIENENIQKIILDGSKGVPYYLDLAIDTYYKIKEYRQPMPHDFARTLPDIFDRFFKYLDKQETETLKVLSVPRFWDYNLFAALVKKFNTGYPLTAFSDLGSFSFTSYNTDGKWYMHQLMKESIQESQDSELRERVNRFIFEYYSEKIRDINLKNITEEHKSSLVEGFYHAKVVLEMSELLKWLITNSEPFEEAALWSVLFPLYEETLQIQEIKLPSEHSDMSILLYKMAELSNKMGKYDEALPFYQRSLESHKNTMKPDNPHVADILNGMAWVNFKSGEYEKALSLYQEALEIREKVLGLEHPDVAKNLDNKAVLLKHMGKYDEALSLYGQALKIRENLFGHEHRSVAVNLNNIAILYKSMGKYEDALLLYQQSLEIKGKILGENHPSFSKTLSNMAVLYKRIGKYEDAVSLCQQALEIKEKALGHYNPSVASTLNDLSGIYECMGLYEEALPLAQQALHIKEKIIGPLNPSVAITLGILAELHKNNGKCEEALELAYRALDIREKVFGSEHPKIAETLNILAGIYGCMENSEKALLLYQRALGIREKLLGSEHPDVAKTLSDMAGIYKTMGESEKAMILYQRALDISEKVLGPKHPYVKTILEDIKFISQK